MHVFYIKYENDTSIAAAAVRIFLFGKKNRKYMSKLDDFTSHVCEIRRINHRVIFIVRY